LKLRQKLQKLKRLDNSKKFVTYNYGYASISCVYFYLYSEAVSTSYYIPRKARINSK
jgi:hypothetical protein